MIKQEVERIYNEELTPKQKQVLKLFLEGYKNADIVQKIGGNDRALATQHLRNICRQFNIMPENDTDYRYTLVELLWKTRSEILIISKECLEKHGIVDNSQSYSYPDRPLKSKARCKSNFESPDVSHDAANVISISVLQNNFN